MSDWPALDAPGWMDTVTTLHMWSQIVGKTRMQFAPMTNHWWNVAMYVTPRGLTTSPIDCGVTTFEIEFDLVGHALRIRDAAREDGFALEPMTVRAFHARYVELLRRFGVELHILGRPVEVADAIPFAADDTHHSYDAAWARNFAGALVRADAVLKAFRGGFLGKSSPVHFFWGGFDLAVTRFSGRPAPRHPGGIPNVADWVMHEAYSHEVASCGFWPGSAWYPNAGFYAYAYPEPAGYADARVVPAAAGYDKALGEYVLPYDAVRRSDDPARDVRAFLESTYVAAADLGRWDRASLERNPHG
jgi:hypothetical protein